VLLHRDHCRPGIGESTDPNDHGKCYPDRISVDHPNSQPDANCYSNTDCNLYRNIGPDGHFDTIAHLDLYLHTLSHVDPHSNLDPNSNQHLYAQLDTDPAADKYPHQHSTSVEHTNRHQHTDELANSFRDPHRNARRRLRRKLSSPMNRSTTKYG
jgi:hypothetical protein